MATTTSELGPQVTHGEFDNGINFANDVLMYNELALYPLVGEDGKIYIAKDTNNRTYRMNLGVGSIQSSEIRMYAPSSGSPAISLFIDNTQRFQQYATPSGSWVTRLYDTSGTGG